MPYDGSLKFDTKIDSTGFESGVKKLKGLSAAAGAGIAVGMGVAIKKGMDFEAQMSTVGSISLASADDMEVLSKKAKEMGVKTVFSATEAGQAMEYMAMAGWKTSEMTSGIEGIMNLAAASGENLATTSDIVTDALTAFGLKAADSGRLADVMAAASANANTNVGLMGETFKYVAPVAGAMGYSIEDTSKAIGLMANSGIKGSQAGTALRAVISRMAKPTKQSYVAMQELGLSVTDSSGKMKSLDQVMLDMRKGFSKLTADQKAQYAAMLGGQEAMSGLLAIANASEDDFNKLGDAINNSAGSAEKMSDIKLDNLKGQLTLMGSAAEGLGIAFYEGIETPLKNAVSNGSAMISGLAQSLSSGELSEPLKNVGQMLGDLVTNVISFASDALPVVVNGLSALSANIVPIGGTILTVATAVAGYKTAMGLAAGATTLFTSAATLLSNPVGLVGAGIGLAALAVVGVTTAMKNAETEFYNMGDALDAQAAKYQTAKDKATLTDDYAAKWRDLNKAISDGSLSGQDLTNAEKERKKIEEWFIENYGKYISAEEEKNGVREDTIDLIQDQVRLLSDKERLELENQMLETKRKLPDLTKSITDLQNSNSELENNNTNLLKNTNTILKYANAYDEQAKSLNTTTEKNQLYMKLINELNSKLGTHFGTFQDAIDKTKSYNKEIEANNSEIEENNTHIQDATDSLQSYSNNCRTLIESSLGDTLQGFSDGFELVKKAQDEINNSGGISEETYDALIKKFPEMKDALSDSAQAPQAVSDKMQDLQTKLDDAKGKAADFNTELNGLPRNIDIKVNLNVPPIPQFARGTKGSKEGPAIVNDGNGKELIQGKDGSFRMVSSGGSALTWLNSGDRVYTAEQTKQMLKHVPHYSSGVGNNGYVGEVSITSFVDKIPDEFQHALDEIELKRELDVVDEQEYYKQLGQLRDKYFAKGSDKWWDYTKQIYKYEQDAAKKTADDTRDLEFKTLDRQLHRNEISEAEYYTQLSQLRDKYYELGSDEYESYTDKICDYGVQVASKARDDEFNALEKMHTRQLMSDDEYYVQLEKLRDKYFTEGSGEWQDYTDKIIDYNISKIKDIAEKIKSKSADIKQNMLNTLTTFSVDTVTVEKLPGALTQIAGRDTQGDYSGADWTKQQVNVQDLKRVSENMEMYYKAITDLAKSENLSDGFYDYLLSLGQDEGYGLASTLLSMSDDERKTFLNNWNEIQALSESRATALSEGIAKQLYSDDVKQTVTNSAGTMSDDFIAELSKHFDEIPTEYFNVGSDAAESFVSGFEGSIQDLLVRINDAFTEMSHGAFNHYNDNRQTVIYAGSNTSAHDIIEAKYQNEIYQSHTSGW